MKKVLIIGGTSGVGLGLSELLNTKGYKVAITGKEKKIIKTSINKNIIIKYLDCTKGNTSLILEEIVRLLGGLDLLVFSAGIGNLNKGLGYKIENHANLLNVLAFTEITDWSYRFFEKQRYGHFVAITSISGLFGSRVAPAYHAAKSYQINYLEGLIQKARKNNLPIYITDIRPGFIDTPMTKGKKMFWMATTEKAAKQIFQLILKKKTHGYITKRWRLVAILIKILPRWLRIRIL